MREPLATTVVCSRSSIVADDTTAVLELTPGGHGVLSLQTMTKIKCTVGVEDEEVRNK